MAPFPQARRATEHNARPAAPEMPRAQRRRERLAIYARQLAIQPCLPHPTRHCRSLLRCMEQTRQPALADNVYRPPRLGAWVLISEFWYKLCGAALIGRGQSNYAAERVLLALDRTLVITTRPVTFSVTFQLISTFRPPAIACRAIKNKATIAAIATAGHVRDAKI